MQAIKRIEGIAAVIPANNIDTDQIIPANYLSTTQKDGLGKYLFSNWRYDSNGEEASDFVLNQSTTKNCKVLISGDNFGCGSSREHAPWALLDFGIQVVISTSIADIFRNNAIKNGLLPIVVDADEHKQLLSQNAQSLAIDIEAQIITAQDFSISFQLESFAKFCFLNGMDQLDFLISKKDAIHTFEANQVSFN